LFHFSRHDPRLELEDGHDCCEEAPARALWLAPRQPPWPGYFTLIFVAQASSLLYRGFPTRKPSEVADTLPTRKSATQPVGNLRYNPLGASTEFVMKDPG